MLTCGVLAAGNPMRADRASQGRALAPIAGMQVKRHVMS